MNSALTDIGMTIVQPLFSLAMLLIAVRFLAQLCGASHSPRSRDGRAQPTA